MDVYRKSYRQKKAFPPGEKKNEMFFQSKLLKRLGYFSLITCRAQVNKRCNYGEVRSTGTRKYTVDQNHINKIKTHTHSKIACFKTACLLKIHRHGTEDGGLKKGVTDEENKE